MGKNVMAIQRNRCVKQDQLTISYMFLCHNAFLYKYIIFVYCICIPLGSFTWIAKLGPFELMVISISRGGIC